MREREREREREKRGEDKKEKKKSLRASKVYTYNTTIKGLSEEAARTARARGIFSLNDTSNARTILFATNRYPSSYNYFKF
jgi:hypothetical protein